MAMPNDPAQSAVDDNPGLTDGSGLLTLGSYNIRHGLGNDGRIDLERTARVIRGMGCSLVALQELDVRTDRCGGVDQAQALAELTGMTVCFGPALDFGGGQYGNAVLSALPITRHHVLALPGTEPRCVLALDVNWGGILVRFCSVHLDLDAAMRDRSVDMLLKGGLFPNSMPVFVGGDFNAEPGQPAMARLTAAWQTGTDRLKTPTFPADSPQRRIDAIFSAGEGGWTWEADDVLSEELASDHRPIRAVLRPAGK